MKKRKLKKGTSKLLVLILLIGLGYLGFYIAKDNLISLEKTEKNKSNETQKEKEPEKKEYKLSMIMVGDALYHSSVYENGKQEDGTYNYDHQFEYIAPIVKKYDLAYYNQETILGGTEIGLSTYPRFNSPYEVGDGFLKAGFNLVSLANNHTLDRGETALNNSCTYWAKQNNVMSAGSYCSEEDRNRSHTGEKNGITYAFFSYTTLTNGLKVPTGKDYYVNVYSDEMAKSDIVKVRDKVDVVIVAMHWGSEYTHVPTSSERQIAEYLESIGVDIIIGTHPHVIQPIEHINDTVVFYSLGNFISAQIGIERLIGMMGSLEITKTIDNGETNIKIGNVKGDLIYTYYQNFKNYKVYPFAKLTNDLLNNKDSLKQKYESIINKNDSSIIVGSLG